MTVHPDDHTSHWAAGRSSSLCNLIFISQYHHHFIILMSSIFHGFFFIIFSKPQILQLTNPLLEITLQSYGQGWDFHVAWRLKFSSPCLSPDWKWPIKINRFYFEKFNKFCWFAVSKIIEINQWQLLRVQINFDNIKKKTNCSSPARQLYLGQPCWWSREGNMIKRFIFIFSKREFYDKYLAEENSIVHFLVNVRAVLWQG